MKKELLISSWSRFCNESFHEITILTNMSKVLEVFEVILITPKALFDRYLRGDTNALNITEKEGWLLFMWKKCSKCHADLNLGGEDYYPLGVFEKTGSEILPREVNGRFEVTKKASDDYVFPSPPLRNVNLKASYFHSGKGASLMQALEIMGNSHLGTKLTDKESEAITAFLPEKQPRIELPHLPPSTNRTLQFILGNQRIFQKSRGIEDVERTSSIRQRRNSIRECWVIYKYKFTLILSEYLRSS